MPARACKTHRWNKSTNSSEEGKIIHLQQRREWAHFYLLKKFGVLSLLRKIANPWIRLTLDPKEAE
jgi:hypothetical protein